MCVSVCDVYACLFVMLVHVCVMSECVCGVCDVCACARVWMYGVCLPVHTDGFAWTVIRQLLRSDREGSVLPAGFLWLLWDSDSPPHRVQPWSLLSIFRNIPQPCLQSTALGPAVWRCPHPVPAVLMAPLTRLFLRPAPCSAPILVLSFRVSGIGDSECIAQGYPGL